MDRRQKDEMIDDAHKGAGRPALGDARMGMIEDYLQPIAQHMDYPERLLLRGADGRWYVWTGERLPAAPEEVPPATAAWLLVQPGLRLLPAPHVWIHRADLPMLPVDAWRGTADHASGDAAAG